MSDLSASKINKLAIPSIIAGLAEPIISFTDLTLVGQNLNSNAIAGVGLGSYTIMLFIWIFSSLRNSTASIVAQQVGMKNPNKTNETISKALLISLALGVLITLVTNLFATSIFGFQNAIDDTLKYSLQYYRIRSLAIPFMLGTLTLIGGFKGFQNTIWAMKTILIGGVINLSLDYLLISNSLPFIPSLGVKGVAIGSLVSQVIMFLISLYYFKRAFTFHLPLPFFNPETKSLLKMSIDLMIRSIAMNTVFILSNKYTTKLGVEQMAAHSILFWIWLFQCYFIDGYSNAAMAISGKLKGMKDKLSIPKLALKTSKINVTIALILVLIFFSITPLIQKIPKEPLTVNALFPSYYIMLLTFPIGAIAFTFDGLLMGLGESKFLRNLLIFSSLLIFIPSIYYFENTEFKLVGIWISMSTWLAFRAVVPTLFFIKKYTVFD